MFVMGMGQTNPLPVIPLTKRALISRLGAKCPNCALGYWRSCYGIFHPEANPYLRFETLARAEKLWQPAEEAALGNPEYLWRVRQSRLSVGYVWLSQWAGLRRECRDLGKNMADQSVTQGVRGAMACDGERAGASGLVADYPPARVRTIPGGIWRALQQRPDEALYETPKRSKSMAAALADLHVSGKQNGITVQDDRAIIFREPDCSRLVADPLASDSVAIRMIAGPGSARGAMEVHTASLSRSFRPGRYLVYYVVRVETAENPAAEANAFQCRVFDASAAKNVADRMVKVSETVPGYRSYLAGTVELNAYSRIWLGHAHNQAVKSVSLDRVFLVPAK